METLEIWKDVVWYEWYYKISNWGLVFSVINSKLLKTYINDSWYIQVQLAYKKKRVTTTIHRMVWIAFIDNIKNKPQINHINWIKTDNRVENLEWCTNSENQLHCNKLWLRKIPKWEEHSKPSLWKKWILSKKARKIWMYDIYGNLKEVFYWWREVYEKTWISQWNINEVCNGKRKLAWGFIWKYL